MAMGTRLAVLALLYNDADGNNFWRMMGAWSGCSGKGVYDDEVMTWSGMEAPVAARRAEGAGRNMTWKTIEDRLQEELVKDDE